MNTIFRDSQEIVSALGLIGSDVDFTKWEPIIGMGLREVAGIIGREAVDGVCLEYEKQTPARELAYAIFHLQQAVGFFTWLRIIPTLDAQHDGAGRGKRLGENEKGLTALQEWKDEENIRRLAYEAVDALIDDLDYALPHFWLTSRQYKMRDGLLIRDRSMFDDYYVIGSSRLFVTILPMLREVQSTTVAPVLGKWLQPVLDEDPALAPAADAARRALALLTMKKAIERLPVEVLPDGVVQVNMSAPVGGKLRAERDARNAVAASLGVDGRAALDALEGIIADLENGSLSGTVDSVGGPIVHSKGMSF